MNTYSGTRKKAQKDRSGLRQRFLTHIGTVFLLIIGLVLLFAPQRAYGQQPDAIESGLLYLQSDTPGRSKIIHKPQSFDNDDSTIVEPFVPAGCAALGMYASPHGPWVAVDVTCEVSGFVQVINIASGQTVDLDTEFIQDSTFLNWSPAGNEMILRVGSLPTSSVYQIQINSGRHEQLPVPGNVYDIAVSTNGRRMIYSLTQGLGYGSETWIADIDGGNAQQVLLEPNHIIAFAHWSPSGNEIVYVRMLDSNIPFTVGELWMMGGSGEAPAFLSNVDAGHGYRPVWSPNSQYIAFVVREQYDEESGLAANEADYVPDKLVSNIYLVDMRDRKISKVTEFDGALTETPIWSPDGAYLAFTTTAGGNGRDIWAYDMQNNNLIQVTHGANTRHPTWLSVP